VGSARAADVVALRVSRTVATPDAALHRTELPNGLTVLSEFMPGVRSVAFGAWVRAASLHELPEQMGVSHLLEHMVFKGTERRTAKQLALELEVLGGSLDAYTSKEHTVYQARVLAEHLDVAADVVGDLLFHPTLRSKDLALERKVVLEEIGMVDDTPDDLVFERHNELLWGGHPYGFPILGTRETVKSLGVKHLRELHDRAYHPGQIVVAAAGAVDHQQLLETLERTGWLRVEARSSERLTVAPAIPRAPDRSHVPREGAQTHLVLGTTAPPHRDPRRHALVLLSTVLGGGMSSRLFQQVREELGLAYSVYTFHEIYADTGVHGVYVATAPETAGQALEAIERELAKVAAEGIPEEELLQGKSQLKGQLTLSLESVTNRMYRAAEVVLCEEPYRTLDVMLAEIDSISAEEVAAVAREFFAPERQTVLTLGPSGAA
jgi:predicted Zn-dependent peptidase